MNQSAIVYVSLVCFLSNQLWVYSPSEEKKRQSCSAEAQRKALKQELKSRVLKREGGGGQLELLSLQPSLCTSTCKGNQSSFGRL